MNDAELERLLQRPESATLEFKREFYALDAANGEAKKRQKHEMVKDILALANGNANVAGETAYLIIGADNTLGEDGNRALFDIGDLEIKSQQLLKIINAYCEPPIQDLLCEPVSIEGTRLLVITIPPSPHLHEMTQKLETPSQTYSPYVVFVRRDETVDLASAREREAIAQLKRVRYHEAQNAPPVQFGAAVGALLIGSAGGNYFVEKTGKKELRPLGWLIGGLLGGLNGSMLGGAYKEWRSLVRDWPLLPKQIRPFAIAAGTLVGVVVTWVLNLGSKRLRQWAEENSSRADAMVKN